MEHVPDRAHQEEEALNRLRSYSAEHDAFAALRSSIQLKYHPPPDCPLHTRLATIPEPQDKVIFIQSHFDGLYAEAKAHPGPPGESAKPGSAESLKRQQFQAGGTTAAVAISTVPQPIDWEGILSTFEGLSGPQRHFYWADHKALIQRAFECQQWDIIQRRAEETSRIIGTPTPNSMRGKLEAITDPTEKARFYKAHEDEIHAEVTAAQDSYRISREPAATL